MKTIPKPYAEKLDIFVNHLTAMLRMVRPFIMELGNNIELDGDGFKLTIQLSKTEDKK